MQISSIWTGIEHELAWALFSGRGAMLTPLQRNGKLI
jgi:hypothetical protein